jgi:GT2 family glycosyltransferase
MYVTRAYIEAVGVMDDNFFVFCEDTDWCLRREKFKLGYAHDSVVHHVHGSASGSSVNKEKRSRFNVYLTERNRVLLARKLYRTWWMFFAAMALLQMVEYIVRARSFAQLRTALEGWLAGVKGRVGPPYFLHPRQN